MRLTLMVSSALAASPFSDFLRESGDGDRFTSRSAIRCHSLMQVCGAVTSYDGHSPSRCCSPTAGHIRSVTMCSVW